MMVRWNDPEVIAEHRCCAHTPLYGVEKDEGVPLPRFPFADGTQKGKKYSGRNLGTRHSLNTEDGARWRFHFSETPSSAPEIVPGLGFEIEEAKTLKPLLPPQREK